MSDCSIPQDSVTEEGSAVVGDGSDIQATGEGPDAGSVTRALTIKGFAKPDGIAAFVDSTEDAVVPIIEALVADGTAQPVGPMFRLSDTGKELGAALIQADIDEWGAGDAGAAHD
ncbi:hypothetical protein HQ535_06725 [bacterium]|nr:hypothetical protein [bacterium]